MLLVKIRSRGAKWALLQDACCPYRRRRKRRDRGTRRRWPRDGRLPGALRVTECHQGLGEAGRVLSYSPESTTLLTP